MTNRPISGRILGLVCGWLVAVMIAMLHETTAEKLTGQTDGSEAIGYLIPCLLVGFLLGWLVDSSRVGGGTK